MASSDSDDRAHDRADELLQAQRILCVQPHYDDNDLGAGGTFAALADAGVDVHYLTITDDIMGVLDPDLPVEAATRQLEAEQRAAGDIIGVCEQHLLNLPDAGAWDEIELRRSVIEHVRIVRPDYVFTCDPWLPHEAHRDHLRTGIAVGEAVMFHRMRRFETRPEVDDAYFAADHDADEAHTIRGLVLYFTREPNLVFDVTKTRDRKHAAIDCYEAQLSPAALEGLHRGLGGMEKRWARDESFSHGEALKLLRPAQLHVGLVASS